MAQITDFVDINKINAELDAVIAKYGVQSLPAFEQTSNSVKTNAQKEKENLEKLFGNQEFSSDGFKPAHIFDTASHKPAKELNAVSARDILNDSDYIDSPFVIQNAANLHAAGLETLNSQNPK